MADTGLHTLMNFMRENNGLFFYCEEKECFALVIGHNLKDTDLEGSFECWFAIPEPDDDIEACFIKPIIVSFERFGDVL